MKPSDDGHPLTDGTSLRGTPETFFQVAFAKYLMGEATPDERTEVERRVATEPDVRTAIELIRHYWDTAPVSLDTPDTKVALARVLHLAGVQPRTAGQAEPTALPANGSTTVRTSRGAGVSRPALGMSRPVWRAVLVSSAAVLVVLLGVSLARRGSSNALSIQKSYQTRSGETATIRLADGSTLMLAPATTVTEHDGRINVMGEAYFTVTAHPSRPLVVTTRNAVVQVLGTRFVVRQYPDESRSRVVVEEGRVALQSLQSYRLNDSRAVISARMLAFVTDSGVTVTSGIATREYTGWTQGSLVFDRAPLRDVVAQLSLVYGAHIRVADSVLAGKKLIAEVDVRQKPLSQVLDFIGAAMNAHYTRSDSLIMLSPGRGEDVVPNGQLPRNRFPQPEKQYGR